MKKYKDWPKGKSATEWLQAGDEVDEELYYYFLEVVPPAIMKGGAFAVGEPLRYNENHDPVYQCFRLTGHTNNKYYYMGELTKREFAEKLGYKLRR